MIFKPAARYPADPRAVFILALSVFSGMTALALDAAPDSLNAVMPSWAVIFWAITLTLGSAITLIGMKLYTVNGVITEQIGSAMVASTTMFYALVAFYLIGADALQNIGIVFAWGAACGVRWFQLQAYINDTAGRAQKRILLERMEAELVERVEREKNRKRFRVDEHDELGHWRDS